MKKCGLFFLLAVLALAPELGAAQDVIEVTLREGTNMALALSPDGQTIAIDLQGRLWTLPVDGGSARALTDELGDVRQQSYAPDGESIAFQSYRDGTSHIWVVGIDGGGLEQVTHGPYDDREPHWSHDGTKIAFSSDRGGTYDLWTIELATGELTQLTRDAGNEFMPVWSPDDASDREREDLRARRLDGAPVACCDIL